MIYYEPEALLRFFEKLTVGETRYCFNQLRDAGPELHPDTMLLLYNKLYYVIDGRYAEKIQSFFRIIMAKNVANRLRVEPDNLFEPEFSDRRKFLLKIDDSRFI